MNAATRLGLYAILLVVVFAVSALTASVVVPEETVQNWGQEGHGHER